MPSQGLLTIGELATLSRVPATTLRYYEKCGLLEPPERVGGQRRYDPSVVGRLMVIRFCRVAGLGLDEIATVLADDSPGRSATKDLARAHIVAIDDQITKLQMARRMMAAAANCVCPTLETCECHAMDDAVAELRAFLTAELAAEGVDDSR